MGASWDQANREWCGDKKICQSFAKDYLHFFWFLLAAPPPSPFQCSQAQDSLSSLVALCCIRMCRCISIIASPTPAYSSQIMPPPHSDQRAQGRSWVTSWWAFDQSGAGELILSTNERPRLSAGDKWEARRGRRGTDTAWRPGNWCGQAGAERNY